MQTTGFYDAQYSIHLCKKILFNEAHTAYDFFVDAIAQIVLKKQILSYHCQCAPETNRSCGCVLIRSREYLDGTFYATCICSQYIQDDMSKTTG